MTVKKYDKEFNGIEINGTSFFYYNICNQSMIHNDINIQSYCQLTSGLILLLEGKGTLKKYENDITQADLNNYFSIIKISNVDINKIEYLTILVNFGIGQGRHGKGLNNSEDNPIELLSELRKLLAAKLAGHNNVYNSVKSVG